MHPSPLLHNLGVEYNPGPSPGFVNGLPWTRDTARLLNDEHGNGHAEEQVLRRRREPLRFERGEVERVLLNNTVRNCEL